MDYQYYRVDFIFEDAEPAQLRAWIGLSTAAKVDFFEEMIELAYRNGALSPERLALRDRASPEGQAP
ncbi:hypothetical protein LDO32_05465 [Luteimonas sp. Y-2-2-4F]|nr:hypothetical protein [Luteimonas sp. Y-2-2-4F]MCD9031178.1 hypothetical protein [Luteimonas sp. Y-2-2-4F]